MTKIRARDLNKMSVEDLESKLVDLRKDLLKVNAQRSTGTALENPGRVKQVRKTIARILTIIKHKKVESQKQLKATKTVTKKKEENDKQ